MSIQITSMLDRRHAGALEELLFFNPQQGRFRRNIIASVGQYGSPRIVERNGGLRIELSLLEDVQTLYALASNGTSEELAGAMVHTRMSDGTLEILHIVVEEEYTCQGALADCEVAFQLVQELCRVGRQIRGVHSVRLAYNRGKVILQTVHHAEGPLTPDRADANGHRHSV